MSDPADKALLPAGMSDVLPPYAGFEADARERLISSFVGYGYERVKPPLIEFEENLLTGSGVALYDQTFRLMDPVSQRMMGVRSDMTLQVARIATTRLKNAPRPLRLGYAGEVLRVKGSQLRPERQFGQVGAELIGTESPTGDKEVILMAVEALEHLGVEDLSVDLGLPTLVPAVCQVLGLDEGVMSRLRLALDRKDDAGVSALAGQLGGRAEKILLGMLSATGQAEDVLGILDGLDLPAAAQAERTCLSEVVKGIRAGAPNLTLTADAVENRGFEYHTGVTFTIFSSAVRGELGRGGRYRAGNGDEQGEPATGLTLFMDSVLRALAGPVSPKKIFIPSGTPADAARTLRGEGWITIEGMNYDASPENEARRMNCTHLLIDGKPREV
ncbi:MAG: ATP phosphoribosyltransferase regulatory subunit [Rhodospirillales bacterium]|nr:ATP phosphoribosyltransferase regulatory subunit [Rhodospirillales bacterium]